MNPKETAEYLVDKFSRVGLQQRNEGIVCALICVYDEIKLLNDLDEKWHESEYAILTSFFIYKIEYLQEVKLEIQKL